jgi:hypothetical protein
MVEFLQPLVKTKQPKKKKKKKKEGERHNKDTG